MSRCGERHLKLEAHGIGKCSVPMWSMGGPDGFCDRAAYGERPRSPERMNYCAGQMQREDGRFNGYVPGLACKQHGGDGPSFAMDGNMWCATTGAFINLQESIVGFGETKELAEADLLRQHREPQP